MVEKNKSIGLDIHLVLLIVEFLIHFLIKMIKNFNIICKYEWNTHPDNYRVNCLACGHSSGAILFCSGNQKPHQICNLLCLHSDVLYIVSSIESSYLFNEVILLQKLLKYSVLISLFHKVQYILNIAVCIQIQKARTFTLSI